MQPNYRDLAGVVTKTKNKKLRTKKLNNIMLAPVKMSH